MSIIARLSDPVTVSPTFELVVRVEFYDDGDPLNAGVGTLAPRNVLFRSTFNYPATLTGSDLQAAVLASVQSKGASYVRALTAANATKSLLPVGALVAVG